MSAKTVGQPCLLLYRKRKEKGSDTEILQYEEQGQLNNFLDYKQLIPVLQPLPFPVFFLFKIFFYSNSC